MPKVSVRDLVIHPQEDDLVLGTHGRGIMIVDDISPLRGISNELLQQDVAFLEMKPFSSPAQLVLSKLLPETESFRVIILHKQPKSRTI